MAIGCAERSEAHHSLVDTEAYPTADFAELYHAHWGIEEAIKLLKHRLLIE